MTIRINGSDFNRIMRVCAPAVSRDSLRPGLCHILIECNGNGEGCATALDGHVLAQTRFPANGDRGKMMLFQHSLVKEDCTVELEYIESTGRTSISDGEMTITRIVPAPGAYVEHHKISKGAQANKKTIHITLDPPIVKKMLKCMAHGRYSPIHLDIYGDAQPIVVHSENGAGLILPMRTSDELKKEPEFWEMIEDG